ncbi:hypothetical protein DUNSADRAFT_2205 [Dunaliella salina]|uniref:Methyltransferase domain-containing protein n=1 Tax=Dunaliella salina TaxID=3046 RepID=A0ABQ7GW35_DUNSA|nr:hypothetical protein DUNSADRAFT_2205 [Dunaliella salina]|eukprot:KAF5838819.1 hypothetical protein DUNSADRAFT_2205 [Dunaliella salina]
MLVCRGGSFIGSRISTGHWLRCHGQLLHLKKHIRSSTRQPSGRAPDATSSGSAATAWSHSIQPTSPKEVPIPLCKRLPTHEAPVHAVLSWHRAMGARVAEIGDSFEQQDLGPSESELKRELDWVLDDTVAAIKHHPEAQWMPCSWRFLEAEVRGATHGRRDTSSWLLLLRASVEQLYEWWTLRLQERVPFQYLIASAHWRQHVLSVGPGVLIPRPETEIFADLVSQALKQRPSLASVPWVDMGTGSGVIAIAAAEALRELNQDARVFAVDLSPVAAAYATANARATGFSDHVAVLQGSWFEPVAKAVAALTQLDTSAPGAAAVQQFVQGGQAESTTGQRGGPSSGVALSRNTIKTDNREGPTEPAPSQGFRLPLTPGEHEQTPQSGTVRPLVQTLHPHLILPSQSSHASDHPPPAEDQPTLPTPCLGGVLSNPPYIPTSTMQAGLQAEVGLHEPWDALDGGEGTGLDSLKMPSNWVMTAIDSSLVPLEEALVSWGARPSAWVLQTCLSQVASLLLRRPARSKHCLWPAY